ncbi:MAG: PAS domain S-box protein [Chitinophagaceae bacterium]|nr:PAS domain S-box protein [Chitinophagaceae bacterium]
MNHSLRNLFIGYTAIVIAVVLIIYYTFSTVRSQEKELATISKTREVLQKIQPVFLDLTEFESQLGTIVIFNKGNYTDAYNEALLKIKNDSALMMQLGTSHSGNRADYHRLASLLHNMTAFAEYLLRPGNAKKNNLPGNTWHSNSGKEIITEFKTIADKLEDAGRKTLSASYNNTINLTRRTFDFVKVMAGILILILFVSFIFIYRDIKRRRKTESRLKQFNTELERQVAEKAALIREKEEKYKRLYASMTDAYSIISMDGQLLEYNPSFKEMLGYTDEELKQKKYKDIIPSKWHAIEEDMVKTQILPNKFSPVYQKEYIHKSGRIFPVELRTFLLEDKEGNPEAMWAIIRDITDRREAENKLAISEKNLRYVLASTSDNFYVLQKKDYRILLINEAAEKNLRRAWGKPVTIGTNLMDVIPADTNEPIRESLERVFSGTKVEYELQHVQSDLPTWVMVTYTPVYDDWGKVIGAYILTKDITERKTAELELTEAESKFRNLVEKSLVGVYILLGDRIAYVNPRFAEIFGYEQSEMINSFLTEMLVHPDDKERFNENVRKRFSGETDSVHYELRCLKKSGEVIEVEVFGSRIQYKGKPAVIGTLLDITERRKTERENEHVRMLLRERVKELSALYQLGQVLQNEKKAISTVLENAVSILPQGWQYTSVTAARIVIGDTEYKTKNYGAVVHSQAAKFKGPEGEQGMVEVVYLEKRPQEKEDAFSVEERNMINMMAEMLRTYLFRRYETEMNKKMQQEILNRKVQEQKTVARAILNAQERERNKIGQELHDNVNQILASIKLYLGMARGKEEEEMAETIRESSQLLDNAIEEIRSLSKSQVTPLKKIDLEELIQALVDKLEETSDVAVKFVYVIKDKQVEDDLKLNIYRIVQEQVNNIVKHAEASVVSIALHENADGIHLSIADNGKGFVPDQKRKGIGLSNMINRVESFNGELDIISSPGNGCEIQIRIPC